MTHPTTTDEAFPGRYLKAADLNGLAAKLTIKSVAHEEVGQNREFKTILYFKNVQKGLVLNKTNAGAIEITHGKVFANWPGKTIELYPTQVPYQGQDVAAIRVRAEAPQQQAFNTPLGTNAPLGTPDPNDPLPGM